jgi:hypothetical protein
MPGAYHGSEKLYEIWGTGHFFNEIGIIMIGNVITIEPGIYDPSLGSCRLEDVVVVTPTGCQNLTSYPKDLVIH